MENNLAQKAIDFAIKGLWHEAYEINFQILKDDSKNIDALNRLAKCFWELGNLKSASSTAQNVLKIDPTNQIALKCLAKYKQSRSNDNKNTNHDLIGSAEAFLEESGKTKIVELLNLGDKKIINSISTGKIVKLATHSHKVSVMTQDNKYIGRLPDDLAVKIKKLTKLGNQYSTIVKSASPNSITVFLREVVNKSKSPSFPTEKLDYVSYTPPELVHKENTFTELES